MFDQIAFGQKLKRYRKNFSLTQEELAETIGVSGQAVSKWEAGDCLPDIVNLRALSRVFSVSLDILLETAPENDLEATVSRIRQLATEFVWANFAEANDGKNADELGAHLEMGNELWEMWKAVYYVEIGSRELQERELRHGKCRIAGPYGLKIWDDAGIACTVPSSIKDHLDHVDDSILALSAELAKPAYYRLFSALDAHFPVSKEVLLEKTGLPAAELNEMLILLTENCIVEFFGPGTHTGYKLTAYRGILAYLRLAEAYLLSESRCSTSEYLPG